MYTLIKHEYIYGMKVKGKRPRVQRKPTVWIEKAETEEYGGNAQSTIYMKIFLDNTVPHTGRGLCVETCSLVWQLEHNLWEGAVFRTNS